MTTTADWLHLKLGLPLDDQDECRGAESEDVVADIVARQKALAAMPLAVRFTGR